MAFGVYAVLHQRVTDALRRTADDLAFDAGRVDGPADVVASGVLEEPDVAGLEVHLDVRGVGAERVVRVGVPLARLRIEPSRPGTPGVQHRGVDARFGRGADQLGQAQAGVPVLGAHHPVDPNQCV